MQDIGPEDQAIIQVVREFLNREVKPVVQDLEHTNTYPEKLIRQRHERARGDVDEALAATHGVCMNTSVRVCRMTVVSKVSCDTAAR